MQKEALNTILTPTLKIYKQIHTNSLELPHNGFVKPQHKVRHVEYCWRGFHFVCPKLWYFELKQKQKQKTSLVFL